jgi:hypothetical protein
MMAPDYAHWHGMYEVADRFYQKLIPQAREVAEHAARDGREDAAKSVIQLIDQILDRPEHQWLERQKLKVAADAAKESLVQKPTAD